MLDTRARLLAATSLVFALLPGLAFADSWTWRDRDDLDRPLSIRSVTAGHLDDKPMVTVTFDQPLRPEEMGEKDFVVLTVDSDGKAPNEEWAYFFAYEGQLHRVSYNPHSDEAHEIDESTFSRPTPESLEIQVTPFAPGEGHIFAAGSYTESAPGCAKGCWDWTPNRGALIHDWTPPWVHGVTEPATWTFQRTLKFYWEASDVGLSGFRRSTLLMSRPGSGRWEAVAKRAKPGRYVVFIRDLNQGSNVMLRPVAVDGAKNKTFGPIRRTRVPYDQNNERGGATFSGTWVEEGAPAFGGTVHTSTAPMDSLTFSGNGNLYCFYGTWGPGVRATFEAGGETVEIDTLAGDDYPGGYPTCIDTETVEDRAATLTVHAGRVSVDWYWAGIYPAEPATAEEESADSPLSRLLPSGAAVPSARELVLARRSISRS